MQCGSTSNTLIKILPTDQFLVLLSKADQNQKLFQCVLTERFIDDKLFVFKFLKGKGAWRLMGFNSQNRCCPLVVETNLHI